MKETGEIRCCANCKNRPIDFYNSKIRINPEEPWKYKEGLTEREIIHYMVEKNKTGLSGRDEEIKVYRKCDTFGWSKIAPFKRNKFSCFVPK